MNDQLKALAHEFAINAISSVAGGVSKQRLISDYLEPVFDTLTLKGGETRAMVAAQVVEITGQIIDETVKVDKDAKNNALRDFKTRFNRGLEKFGQLAKLDEAPKIGLKTTKGNISVVWEDVPLYYDTDEEGKVNKDKPMTRAAHTKKYGSKDEAAKDELTPLDKGEERIVMNVSSPALLANSIMDVCKLHGLDPVAVAESMLARSKPVLSPDMFTLAAEKLAGAHPSIDWEQAFNDNGKKLSKVDVQAIIDSQAA